MLLQAFLGLAHIKSLMWLAGLLCAIHLCKKLCLQCLQRLQLRIMLLQAFPGLAHINSLFCCTLRNFWHLCIHLCEKLCLQCLQRLQLRVMLLQAFLGLAHINSLLCLMLWLCCSIHLCKKLCLKCLQRLQLRIMLLQAFLGLAHINSMMLQFHVCVCFHAVGTTANVGHKNARWQRITFLGSDLIVANG